MNQRIRCGGHAALAEQGGAAAAKPSEITGS
jgi:hypothetical protein